MTAERYAAATDLVERYAAAFASAVPDQPEDVGFYGPRSVTWRLAADRSAASRQVTLAGPKNPSSSGRPGTPETKAAAYRSISPTAVLTSRPALRLFGLVMTAAPRTGHPRAAARRWCRRPG